MRIRLFLFFMLLASVVWGQDGQDFRKIYQQAEAEYNIGHFTASVNLLNDNIKHFTGTLKVSAYRLLALCYIGEDNVPDAEKNVSMLLNADPYYTVTIHDPARFSDMVEKLKKGGAMLVTASMQAEKVEEAPVPVTLITEDMMKAIGARNLKDVLTAYVPGMSSIENGTDQNVAMRGVYTSEQEKILIMMDGHRLNSYFTNSSAPDYSISLEKVKQIEVLRGPASSLYGNVALTAVVNIITKNGSDVDGMKASYGMGNYGQYKADLIFGKRFTDTDIIGWCSFYQSDGEKVYEDKKDGHGFLPLSGNITLNGFKEYPSLDVGFKFQWKNFYAMYNYQQSKMIPTYSMSVFRAPYSYEKYRSIDGMKPGHGHAINRGELGYKGNLKNVNINAALYIDVEETNYYDVSGDTIPPVSTFPIEGTDESITPTIGCSQSVNTHGYLYGMSVKANYDYSIHGWKGSFLSGIQLDNYNLNDNSIVIGQNYGEIIASYSKEKQVINTGNEISFSGFMQLKQHLGKYLIANAGLRYDYKDRLSGTNIQNVSPRIALIYLRDNWDVKLNYSQSFVDAPYFYRNNTLKSYKGADALSPEYMYSYQLTFSRKFKPIHLTYEGNVYYNHLKDIIYNDASNKDTPYINAGFFKSCGMEHSLHYFTDRIRSDLNLTWQWEIDSKNYTTTGHKINDVPTFMLNWIVSAKVLSKDSHTIWIHTNMNLLSKQTSVISSGLGSSATYKEQTIPTRAVLNCGIDYIGKHLGLSLSSYNVLDSTYLQGGSGVAPIQQTGMWYMATATYKF